MLARTPPWSPWRNTKESREAFDAGVEKIRAECRAKREKLAADRAAFWGRATAPISDEQWDHNNERWNNGEGEV